MKPEKPLMTDWYVMNFEGISQLRMYQVLCNPCPCACPTVNLSLHTEENFCVKEILQSCSTRQKAAPQISRFYVMICLLEFHIGGSEFELQWKISWSQRFMFIHSTPLVESPAHSQNFRRPVNLQGWILQGSDLWIWQEPEFLELQLCKSKFWWWLFVWSELFMDGKTKSNQFHWFQKGMTSGMLCKAAQRMTTGKWSILTRVRQKTTV